MFTLKWKKMSHWANKNQLYVLAGFQYFILQSDCGCYTDCALTLKESSMEFCELRDKRVISFYVYCSWLKQTRFFYCMEKVGRIIVTYFELILIGTALSLAAWEANR